MKYIDWYSAMQGKLGKDIKRYADNCINSDPAELIAHLRNELAKADEDIRWQELAGATDRAENALKGGDVAEIASAWCRLGMAVEKFEHPSSSEMLELLEQVMHGRKAMTADLDRQRPNFERKAFRQIAQEIAAEEWSNDPNTRVGEMCESVYRQMLELEESIGRNYLPGQPEGIKPWLRKVAPESAKRPGRPKKT